MLFLQCLADLASGANLLAVEKEDERYDAQDSSQERRKCASPLVTEAVIKLLDEERKDETENISSKALRSQS